MPLLDERRWYELYCQPHAGSATPAIFIDRDGVIIEDKHYLRDPDCVELIPGAAQKLAALQRLGRPLVLVTNQSGIGRGMFSWRDFELVQERIVELLGMSAPFSAVYANGYAPDEPDATWRKPNPGMFTQAAADLNLCLSLSIMIGDKLVDMQAASCAGVRRLVHVMTGHGAKERADVIKCCPHAELIDSLGQFTPAAQATSYG